MMHQHLTVNRMRTTLDIEDDVLAAAKEMASRQRLSTCQVVSRLLRQAMSGISSTGGTTNDAAQALAGFQPFPSQGILITDTQIDALCDTEGV